MRTKLYSKKGFLLFEAIVAIFVLLTLFTVKTQISISSMNANRRMHSRQICNAAALAQLDSINCTGARLTGDEIEQLWQGVSLRIASQPGRDQWQGLEQVSVVAELKLAEDDVVSCRQTRYISDWSEDMKNDEVEDAK